MTVIDHPATLTLPAPFTDCEVGAYMEHGRRQLCWRLEEPGQLARNRYVMAWFDLSERVPFKGEPLWLSATRRLPGDSYARQSFTAAGRDAVAALVLPAVMRYGFSRAWTEAHGAKAARSVDSAQRAVDDARARARWFEECAELASMHAAGLLEFRPVPDAPLGQRAQTVALIGSDNRRSFDEVAAEAVLPDGERAGWLTRRGDLVPDESVLNGRM